MIQKTRNEYCLFLRFAGLAQIANSLFKNMTLQILTSFEHFIFSLTHGLVLHDLNV